MVFFSASMSMGLGVLRVSRLKRAPQRRAGHHLTMPVCCLILILTDESSMVALYQAKKDTV